MFFYLLLFAGCNFADFDTFQYTLSKEAVVNKIDRFLKKDPSLCELFEITERSFILYATQEDKQKNKPEYTLHFSRFPFSFFHKKRKAKAKPKSLSGLRIAIDPGHFGGTLAKVEERFISIKKNAERTYEFEEANLAQLSAFILKELLEKNGACILLTKEALGSGAHPLSFEEWQKANGTDFARYNREDLYFRAKKINAFCPDLTIIIHYNAHEENAGKTTQKNYNMLFTPGSFCKGELKDKESRYEFLRLLTSDDLLKSATLCSSTIKRLDETLGVPAVKSADEVGYLDSVCLKIDEGVYARNLLLTRLVHGPVVYGETLCQNNVKELELLSQKDLVLNGITGPKRAQEVAYGYFLGIVDYLKKE